LSTGEGGCIVTNDDALASKFRAMRGDHVSGADLTVQAATSCMSEIQAAVGLPDDGLVSLNVAGLRTVCQYLGLPFRHRICSQLAIDYPDGLSAWRWAPWISAKLSADVYINPVGGRELFDPADFAHAGVSLQFLDFASFSYDTRPYNFEKDLSILDVRMWNSPDVIVQALRKNSSLISTVI
jgi:hypothetical protein